MMFKHRFHDAIIAGTVTRTYRRWQRPQVKPGNAYRLANRGWFRVTSLTTTTFSAITAADLKATGLTHEELGKLLGDTAGDLYCIDFEYLGDQPALEPTREAPTDPGELAALGDKLAAMDRRSGFAWTAATLRVIAGNPGVPSARLCELLGREQAALKKDVRKLKALGLTISLERGYKLSARGESCLRHLAN